jgi:hypothetical protein
MPNFFYVSTRHFVMLYYVKILIIIIYIITHFNIRQNQIFIFYYIITINILQSVLTHAEIVQRHVPHVAPFGGGFRAFVIGTITAAFASADPAVPATGSGRARDRSGPDHHATRGRADVARKPVAAHRFSGARVLPGHESVRHRTVG